MTRELFNEIYFRKGMRVFYKSSPYEVVAVDFESGEIAFVNENGNRVWRSCKHFQLP